MKEFYIRLVMYPLCIFLMLICGYTLADSPFTLEPRGGSIWPILGIIIILVYLIADIKLLFQKKK